MENESENLSPTFTDKKGRKWTLQLDPILIEEIEESHGVNLVDLNSDPMLAFRFDTRKLVSVVSIICNEQVKEAGVDEKDFRKSIPIPPDPVFCAVQAAIVNFFQSGRSSHVREVLAEMEEMAKMNDRILLAELQKISQDPSLTTSLSSRLKKDLANYVEDFCNQTSSPITSKYTDQT